MRVKTPFEREARAVLSVERKREKKVSSSSSLLQQESPSCWALLRCDLAQNKVKSLTNDRDGRESSTDLSRVSRAGHSLSGSGRGESDSVGERVSTVAVKRRKGGERREGGERGEKGRRKEREEKGIEGTRSASSSLILIRRERNHSPFGSVLSSTDGEPSAGAVGSASRRSHVGRRSRRAGEDSTRSSLREERGGSGGVSSRKSDSGDAGESDDSVGDSSESGVV